MPSEDAHKVGHAIGRTKRVTNETTSVKGRRGAHFVLVVLQQCWTKTCLTKVSTMYEITR